MAAEPDPGVERPASFKLSGSWSGRFNSTKANITEIPRNRQSTADIKQMMSYSGRMLVTHVR